MQQTLTGGRAQLLGVSECVHFETVIYVIIGRVDAHTGADALSLSLDLIDFINLAC